MCQRIMFEQQMEKITHQGCFARISGGIVYATGTVTRITSTKQLWDTALERINRGKFVVPMNLAKAHMIHAV